MKTRYKVVLAVAIIILVIVVVAYWDDITLQKYEYIDYGYFTGNTIDIEGVIYVSVNEDTYNAIYQAMKKQGISPFAYEAIGRFDYTLGDNALKYKLYGSKNIQNRILLSGEDAYIIDSNYPKVYFCRQDILQTFGDMNK